MLRNPRAFAFVLLAFGIGVLAWYGERWYRLPDWSEAEIAQSVELNLALDLERRGAHLQPTPERLAALRQAIRAEVEAEIRRDREEVEQWLGLGLLLVVLGAGQWIFSLAVRR